MALLNQQIMEQNKQLVRQQNERLLILGKLFGGDRTQEDEGTESDLDKQYRREKEQLAGESSDWDEEWAEDWQGVERESTRERAGIESNSDDDEDGGEMMPLLNF